MRCAYVPKTNQTFGNRLARHYNIDQLTFEKCKPASGERNLTLYTYAIKNKRQLQPVQNPATQSSAKPSPIPRNLNPTHVSPTCMDQTWSSSTQPSSIQHGSTQPSQNLTHLQNFSPHQSNPTRRQQRNPIHSTNRT